MQRFRTIIQCAAAPLLGVLLSLPATAGVPSPYDDTDGDGFTDATENQEGTSPTDPLSRPVNIVTSGQHVYTQAQPTAHIRSTPNLSLAFTPSGTELALGSHRAEPTVYLQSSPVSDPGSANPFFVHARPTVHLQRFGTPSETGEAWGLGSIVATPTVYLKNCDADFENGLDPFTPFDLASSAEWHIETIDGRTGAFIDNVGHDVPAEDWLIGPPLTVPAGETLSLTFDYWHDHQDLAPAGLQVLVSTTFTTGPPNIANWTDVTPDLGIHPERTWSRVQGITIQGQEGSNVRIAFRYTSTGTTTGTAKKIGIDNVCAHQNIYLPPEITSFTADGNEITDGMTLTRDTFLAVSATNFSRVGFAEFLFRPAGQTAFTTLGEDIRTSNGLEALWAISQLPDGDYEIAARLWNGGNFTERLHPVTVALATPGAPTIVTPTGTTTTQLATATIRVDADLSTEIRLRQNGAIIATRRSTGAPLYFPVTLPLGPNEFTAVAVNRAGSSPPSNLVTITREVRVPILALNPDTNTLVEGASLGGTVSLDAPLVDDLLVTLTPSIATEIDPGLPVLIRGGETSGSFLISAFQDNTIDPPLAFNLTAQAPLANPVSTALTLVDDDWPMLTLTVNRPSVGEGDGPMALLATITRDTTLIPLEVLLTSSDPTELAPPPMVAMDIGQASVTVPVAAIEDSDLDGTQIANLQASVEVNGQSISQSPPVPVSVTDNESPFLVLEFPSGYVLEGATAPLTVRRVGGAHDQDLTVTLTGADPAQLTVPDPVVIPAGMDAVTIDLAGVVDGEADDTATVLVSAVAPSFTSAEIPVEVIDRTLPDLVLKDLSAPTGADTDASFQLTFTLENTGLLATTAASRQKVFLSTDQILDANDTELGRSDSPLTLDPGASYSRTLTLTAPTQAGTYHLLVVADTSNAIDEISETNNLVVLPEPFVVAPAYTATIAVADTVYPANQSIPFTGTATLRNGSPAAVVPVTIHVRRGGTNRQLLAITDTNGDYTVNWNPLPGEGGDYEVAATHPGAETAPTQDTFTILTFQADFPNDIATMDEGAMQTVSGQVTNPSSLDLTNVVFTPINLPAGIALETTLPATDLAGGETWDLGLKFTADEGVSGNFIINSELTSDEGVTTTIETYLTVRPKLARLVVTPSPIRCSVVRGEQKLANLTVENTGSRETGPINLALPASTWILPGSPNPLPSIAPGGAATVSVLLAPSESQALTLFEGNLVIAPENGPATGVPFEFRTVSDATGDLQIEVVDEFYFFGEGSPALAGARVTVRDAITSEPVATATTNADGLVTFHELTEAYYTIEVAATDHTTRRVRVYVDAGETSFQQIFTSRNLVTYTWTVEEVEIEDVYEITVESTFETNVPAPVVTVTPAALDLTDVQTLGQTKVVNMVIENHGLIAANDAEFFFDEHPFYEITPLISDLGTIPAKSTIEVPVTIRRIGVFDEFGNIISLDGPAPARKGPAAGSGNDVSCSVSGGLGWGYPCGPNQVDKTTPVAVSGVEGNCGSKWQPPRIIRPDLRGDPKPNNRGPFPTQTGSGDPVVTYEPISFGLPTKCDCKFIPNICMGLSAKMELDTIANAIKKAISGVTPPWLTVTEVKVEIGGDGKLCSCCIDGVPSFEGSAKAKGSLTVKVVLGYSGEYSPEFSTPNWADIEAKISAVAGVEVTFTGTLQANVEKPCGKDLRGCASGKLELSGFPGIRLEGEGSAKVPNRDGGDPLTASGSIKGEIGITGSVSVSVQWCSDTGMKLSACASLVPVLGVEMKLTDPLGEEHSQNFSLPLPKYQIGCGGPAPGRAPAHGSQPPSFEEMFGVETILPDPYEVIIPEDELIRSDARIIAEDYPELLENDGTCAQVSIELTQQAVLTRSAFEANLKLTNNLEDAPLTSVGFELDVRDASGLPAGDHFNIQVTNLDGTNAIDGSGTIAALATGCATWTIIPRDTAAPDGDTVYEIGGTITYSQNGVPLTIPVEPVRITVTPDAQLFLKYFHQRDVFSDDPHTAAIEPSVPYNLAVLIENRGAGPARNLSITSSQPEIVDNEKGLLIDFQVIGSQVNGMNATPSLAANFGDIAPGGSALGTWFLTSSLQGLFVDYEATFEHLTGLGDERLSLIKELEIHEMNHMVQALGAKDDGLPDFLTNDIPDFNDFPDTIHFSDGGTAPVLLHQQYTAAATDLGDTLEVQLTTSMGSGWSYLRIPDPANGDYTLESAMRSDGLVIPVDRNVWLTDRTFIGLGNRPRYENILHLVDCDSTGSYTLIFRIKPPADTDAPTSAVAALPAQSPNTFQVSWSGSDDMGLAFFDVLVSENGGPFTPWQQQTTATTALFTGTTGTTYAFQSIATDQTGNVEAAPPAPDAETIVSIDNLPPVLDPIANMEVPEGSTFRFQVTANDPDGPDSSLRYSISSDASGLTINPQTGFLSWLTGESSAGTTVSATITVVDSGIPARSATTSFQLNVTEVNNPPVLTPLPPETVAVDELLVVAVEATDPDIPAQDIRFSLGAGAPEGMELDPVTGGLSWSPARSDAGRTYLVDILATDNGSPTAQGSTRLSVTVPSVSTGPPAFAQLPALLWLTPGSYEFTVTASDPDADPVTIAANLTGLPGKTDFITTPGSGSGRFTWIVNGVAPGIYAVPLTASNAGGEITNATLQVRIEAPDEYYQWAATNLAGVLDPADFGMFANPDGDDANNLCEMIFLRNPFATDNTPVDFSKVGPINENWSLYEMSFNRHPASNDFARIQPLFTADLQNWDPLSTLEYQPLIEPFGDHDNDPDTQNVLLRIFAPNSQESGIYGLGCEPLPHLLP